MRHASLHWIVMLAGAFACSEADGQKTGRSTTEADAAPPADAYSYFSGGTHPMFLATELLSRPTSTGISVSVVPAVAVELFVEHGLRSGSYSGQTEVTRGEAAVPVSLSVAGLPAGTLHYYRVRYRLSGEMEYRALEERTFYTARKRGQSFRFTIQSDPHLDDRSSLDLYHQTLENQAEDRPDFMIDLGDTFMTEKHAEPFSATLKSAPSSNVVRERYLFERENFGRIAHSVPLFLVNGNHDGETGWNLNGTPECLPIWAATARKTYFAPPLPNGFYSGHSESEPHVGPLGSYYAWEWGDAQFIVLDPYWHTSSKAKNDMWVSTLGKTQYDWLVATLAGSQSSFRFVFIHNLVGGADGQARGGVEAAPYFEWGGQNPDGTDGFSTRRPGWSKPIHQLLLEHGVTAVFHGHDHLFVRQERDGIVYQEVPQPSAPNFDNGPTLAREGHYSSGIVVGSSGHIRVDVDQQSARLDYVRAYRSVDEKQSRKNGEIAHSYTMYPSARASVSTTRVEEK